MNQNEREHARYLRVNSCDSSMFAVNVSTRSLASFCLFSDKLEFNFTICIRMNRFRLDKVNLKQFEMHQ